MVKKIETKMWNTTIENVADIVHKVFQFKTTENVYNSQTSYRATAYKAPAEEVSIVDCIKSASLSREEMYEVILQVVDTFENKDLKTICKNLHNKNKKELLLAGVILHNIGN